MPGIPGKTIAQAKTRLKGLFKGKGSKPRDTQSSTATNPTTTPSRSTAPVPAPPTGNELVELKAETSPQIQEPASVGHARDVDLNPAQTLPALQTQPVNARADDSGKSGEGSKFTEGLSPAVGPGSKGAAGQREVGEGMSATSGPLGDELAGFGAGEHDEEEAAAAERGATGSDDAPGGGATAAGATAPGPPALATGGGGGHPADAEPRIASGEAAVADEREEGKAF